MKNGAKVLPWSQTLGNILLSRTDLYQDKLIDLIMDGNFSTNILNDEFWEDFIGTVEIYNEYLHLIINHGVTAKLEVRYENLAERARVLDDLLQTLEDSGEFEHAEIGVKEARSFREINF